MDAILPTSEITIIRASSLSTYADCPRRAAARIFEADVRAAGYDIRTLGTGIGATVGTAVHAASAEVLRHKMKTGGDLPSVTDTEEVAVEALRVEIDKSEAGVEFDTRVTPNLNDGQIQVARMARVFRSSVAPGINPLTIEERLEAVVSPSVVVSGQSDILARTPTALHDLKTGIHLGYHGPQVGAYSLLQRSHGLTVQSAMIDYISRVAVKEPQPDVQVVVYDLAACETAAVAVLAHIEADIRTFREGDAKLRTQSGDPWAFPANPSSKLCSAKWCPAHGTNFCREHAVTDLGEAA